MRNTVLNYYKKGYYTNEQMKVFVKAKFISAEDYEQATGIPYEA